MAYWKGYPRLPWLHAGGPLGALVGAAFPSVNRHSRSARSARLRRIAGRVGMGLWVVNLGRMGVGLVHVASTD